MGRYYFHGDYFDPRDLDNGLGKPGQVYCSRCDAWVEPRHVLDDEASHPGTVRTSRDTAAGRLAHQKKTLRKSVLGPKRYRPADAPNVLE